jgi:hypothetical protein
MSIFAPANSKPPLKTEKTENKYKYRYPEPPATQNLRISSLTPNVCHHSRLDQKHGSGQTPSLNLCSPPCVLAIGGGSLRPCRCGVGGGVRWLATVPMWGLGVGLQQ